MPNCVSLPISANSKEEEKSEGDCSKHKILEQVGFMSLFECIKNLNRLKENVVFKAKGTR